MLQWKSVGSFIYKSLIGLTLNDTLARYIPEHAVRPVFELIVSNQVHLKIVNERQTRHGDYRRSLNGKHEITVNASLN